MAWCLGIGLVLWPEKPGNAAATILGGGQGSLAYQRWNGRISPEDSRFIRFMQAVFENDLGAVEKAVDSGMAVEWETETGLTPVSLAVAAGHEKIAMLLLRRGGRVDRPEMMPLIILHQSLPLVKFLDAQDPRHPLLPEELNWALRMGSSTEVVDFLIRKVSESGMTPDCCQPFSALAESRAYSSPNQKIALAHRLLDAGILPKLESMGGRGIYNPLAALFLSAKDSTLLKRLPDWDWFHPLEQGELDRRLGNATSLQEVDSLLALGADPLGMLQGYGQGGVNGVTGFLQNRIRTGSRTAPDFSAMDWKIASRFMERAPKQVGPLLENRDFLFMGATTGRLDMVKALLKSAGGEGFVLLTRTASGNTALSYAAEAGDSAMTAYFLKFGFKPKDKEWALQKAVLAGKPSVVVLLLKHGADANLPSFGGRGLDQLFAILFGYRYGFPVKNDTLIARSLLAAYRPVASPFLAIPSLAPPSLRPAVQPISLTRCAVQRKYNPTLLAFLLRQIPGPINADTLFKGLYRNWDVLGDSGVMNRVSLVGHEEDLREAILYAYPWCPLGKIKDAPKRALAALDRLNGFIDKGVDLGKGLDADWHASLGKYQIEYDGQRRRFVLVWRIPSMFSAKANFNHLPSDAGNRYRWLCEEP